MTALKILLALLMAAACLIPYLALTEEYERESLTPPTIGRVLRVEDGVVHYERYMPGSQWDDDRDGWTGPYSDDDVPSAVRDVLLPGTPLELRGGQLEVSRAGPSKFLLVGFVLSLLAGVYWALQPMLRRRRLARAGNDPIEVLKVMMRRSRSQSLVVAVIMLTIGAGFLAVAVFADGETWEMVFVGVLGLLAVVIAIPALRGVWALRNIENAPLLDAVLHAPQTVVWIYEQLLTVNGVPQHSVFLHFSDGQRFHFNLGDQPSAPLIAALHQRLPHVVVGYNPQWEAQWQNAPDNFLRSV